MGQACRLAIVELVSSQFGFLVELLEVPKNTNDDKSDKLRKRNTYVCSSFHNLASYRKFFRRAEINVQCLKPIEKHLIRETFNSANLKSYSE